MLNYSIGAVYAVINEVLQATFTNVSDIHDFRDRYDEKFMNIFKSDSFFNELIRLEDDMPTLRANLRKKVLSGLKVKPKEILEILPKVESDYNLRNTLEKVDSVEDVENLLDEMYFQYLIMIARRRRSLKNFYKEFATEYSLEVQNRRDVDNEVNKESSLLEALVQKANRSVTSGDEDLTALRLFYLVKARINNASVENLDLPEANLINYSV